MLVAAEQAKFAACVSSIEMDNIQDGAFLWLKE